MHDLTQTELATTVAFRQPMRTFSWAPWNGGLQPSILAVVNRTLADDEVVNAHKIERFLPDDLRAQGLDPNTTVGLMTTVPQRYLQVASRSDTLTGLVCTVWTTVGTGNAVAPGDHSAYSEELGDFCRPPGTINIILAVNRALTDVAMFELSSVIVQAKASVLHEEGIRSRTSGRMCTGTGTDVVVVCALQHHEVKLKYAGLCTRLAELSALAAMEAMRRAIEHKRAHFAQLAHRANS